VGVNHGRFDILVAEKLLDRSDVIATLEQVNGEEMAEGVASGPLGQSRLQDRLPHGFLNERFIRVMAALLPGLGGCPPVLLREDPLPAPFGVRVTQPLSQVWRSRG